MTEMGPLIKKARKEAGLTMEGLGEKIGLSAQTIKDWEAGRRQPTLDNLRQLATVVGKNPGWFLDDMPQPGTPSNPRADNHDFGSHSPESASSMPEMMRLLARQQSMTEEHLSRQHQLMEKQHLEISRLTDLLAKQQDEAIAEREFNRRFASEQVARVQTELGALRQVFDGFSPGQTEQEKLAAAVIRLEAAEKLLATTRKLPPAKAREAVSTATPAEP